MKHRVFESSKADPDVWFCEAKIKNGEIMYKYVILYTDDCLVISTKRKIFSAKRLADTLC